MNIAQKHPEKVKLISFEDKTSNPNEILEEIQMFFDLPIYSFSSQVPTNSSNELKQTRMSLSEFDTVTIENAMKRTRDLSLCDEQYFQTYSH